MEREYKILQVKGERLCGLCLDRGSIPYFSIVIVPAERDEEEVGKEIELEALRNHIKDYHRN
jgi:hypothetical protein